jgi:hypothetical protein
LFFSTSAKPPSHSPRSDYIREAGLNQAAAAVDAFACGGTGVCGCRGSWNAEKLRHHASYTARRRYEVALPSSRGGVRTIATYLNYPRHKIHHSPGKLCCVMLNSELRTGHRYCLITSRSMVSFISSPTTAVG